MFVKERHSCNDEEIMWINDWYLQIKVVRFILVSSVLQGLFVYCLLSSLRIFQSWGDITFADEGLQNLGLSLVYTLNLIVPLELTITDLIFLLCKNCVESGFSLICSLLEIILLTGIIFTIRDMLMSYVFIVKVCKYNSMLKEV